MITKISPITNFSKSISIKSTPSFGLARLNQLGRESADSFGYQHNNFLESDMFKKQGLFKKTALSTMIADGEDFAGICREYGCSKNANTNAQFIINQILNPKSKSALKSLDQDEYADGLITLYKNNYDNPELSQIQTRELLLCIKPFIESQEFVKHAGILAEGTKK